MRTVCAIAAVGCAVCAVPAADFRAAFTNDVSILTLDGMGCAVSLAERSTGRELLAEARPFVRLISPDGRNSMNPASFYVNGDVGVWSFAGMGEVALSFRSFGGGWKVAVERFTVPRDGYSKMMVADFRPVCTNYYGSFACMYSDDESGVCVRSGSPELLLDIWDGSLRAYVPAARAGLSAAIVAGPRDGLRPALKAATHVLGAPKSSCGGAWALDSERVRLSTLFGDISESSCEDVLDFCERAAFGIVHFEHWTHCFGHYPVRENMFPGGIEGMSRASKRLHDAGILTGIHTLTGCISNWDPWIRERTRELQSRWSYSLAEPLSAAESNELRVAEMPRSGHDLVLTYGSDGNVLRIGDELMQYSGVRREKPFAFTGLVRGAFGTKSAAHAAGSSCDYMLQKYIAFYPAGDSRLADDLADAIGRVFRGSGMDEIYTDGTDALLDQSQCTLVRGKIFDALGRKDVIVESAGQPVQGWWFHSRLGTWDCPRWGVKAWQDHHIRIADYHRKANLLAPTTGWWAFGLASRRVRGQFVDEAEYFAAKNAAADTATTVQDINLAKGPAFESQVRQGTVFGWYERFRRARAFSDEAMEMLVSAKPGEECRLRQDGAGVWRIAPQRVVKHRFAPGAGAAEWNAEFPSGRHAILRVEALYAAEDPAGTNACELVPGVSLASNGRFMSGCVEFPYPYRSVGGRDAVGMWVEGDGSGALLDLRVKSAREYNPSDSHHLLRLDFTGRRFVKFLFRERDAELLSGRDWPFSLCGTLMANHDIYRNPLVTEHISAVECVLTDLPGNAQSAKVGIGRIVALPVAKTHQRDIVVTVNGERLALPFELVSGEYAELESGHWWKYSESGDLVARAPGARQVALAAGENRFAYSSAADGGEGRAEVTVFGVGRGIPALRRVGGDAAKLLEIEALLPQVYAPAKGLDKLPSIVMRPGETASLSIEIGGSLVGGTVLWERVDGRGSRKLSISQPLAAGDRFVCRDGRRWKIVDAKRAVKAEGELDEPLVGFSGRWRMRMGTADPESAHVRVEMMKRYSK